MTTEEFKNKLATYLIKELDSPYEAEEVDDEILIDLFYEFIQESFEIQEQAYVSFDFENFTVEPGEFDDNGGALLGVRKVNGLPFIGVLAGGDWEVPVFFIIFFDKDDKLKVYVPEKGNLFNKFTLEAYGNEGEDIHELGMKYSWGDIQKDIHDKVKNENGKVFLEFAHPKRKEKSLSERSSSELRKMLDESLEIEDYKKAAEIKKELDEREMEDF